MVNNSLKETLIEFFLRDWGKSSVENVVLYLFKMVELRMHPIIVI